MVAEILASIASALEIAKNTLGLLPAKGMQELREQVLMMQHQLQDVQRRSQELLNENDSLRAQVQSAKKELAAFTDFEFREHMYWRKGAVGVDMGPFCQLCMDRDRKISRIHAVGEGFRCVVCGFNVGLNKPKGPRVISPGIDIYGGDA